MSDRHVWRCPVCNGDTLSVTDEKVPLSGLWDGELLLYAHFLCAEELIAWLKSNGYQIDDAATRHFIHLPDLITRYVRERGRRHLET